MGITTLQLIKTINASLLIRLPFKRPILNWQPAQSKFFEMIYGALTPNISVSASHFSVSGDNNLGNVNAKYNVFGGAWSIKLSSELLEFELPQVTDDSNETLNTILLAVHDALPRDFPEIIYDIVDTRAFLHGELLGDVSTSDFLKRHQVEDFENSFGKFGMHLSDSTVRFEVRAADLSWLCRFSAEKSQQRQIQNGLFLDIQTVIGNAQEHASFVQKSQRIQELRTACLQVVGLQIALG
jgi:hypothetical protein